MLPFGPGWSEFCPVGITQITLRSLQAPMSVNTSAGLRSTLNFHSGPVHLLKLPLGVTDGSQSRKQNYLGNGRTIAIMH